MSCSVRPASSPHRAHIRILGSLLATSLLGGSDLSLAAEGPVNEPSPVPIQQELIPDLPEFPSAPPEMIGPLRLFSAEPFGPDDKGGTYTDMGVGQAGRLTQREEALLALGRAAVEASRAAGTLEVRREHTTLSSSADQRVALERQKRESLLHPPASAPVFGTGSPADLMRGGGVLELIPSGPFELTPSELEKLGAAQGAATPKAEGNQR